MFGHTLRFATIASLVVGILVCGSLSCASPQDRMGSRIQHAVEQERWADADSLVGELRVLSEERADLYSAWVRKKKFEAMRAEVEERLGDEVRVTTLDERERDRMSARAGEADTSGAGAHMGSGYRALGRALARTDGAVADERINLAVLQIPPADEARSQGLRTQSEIESVAAGAMNLLVACYRQGLDEHGSLNGTVVVRFTAGEDGRVRRAEVLQSSLDARSVEECLVISVRAWQLSPGPRQEIDWPFTFETQ